MNTKTLVQRNPNLVMDMIDGDLIIMNPSTGEYYGAKYTGSQIWNLIATPTTIAQIVSELLTRFDVDEVTLRTDVIEFVEMLHKEGLVFLEDNP